MVTSTMQHLERTENETAFAYEAPIVIPTGTKMHYEM